MILDKETEQAIIHQLCQRPGGAEESEIQETLEMAEQLMDLLLGNVQFLIHR